MPLTLTSDLLLELWSSKDAVTLRKSSLLWQLCAPDRQGNLLSSFQFFKERSYLQLCGTKIHSKPQELIAIVSAKAALRQAEPCSFATMPTKSQFHHKRFAKQCVFLAAGPLLFPTFSLPMFSTLHPLLKNGYF